MASFDRLTICSEKLGKKAMAAGLSCTTAESCTGGMVAAAMTEIAGSSDWFERGFVTYSNEAKIAMLGVNESTLTAYGAVSEEVASEMAVGAIKQSQADVSVSVSGIAGPGGGSALKPVGYVCFAWADQNSQVWSTHCNFEGDRRQVRLQATEFALNGLLALLDNRISEFTGN